jgi:hypothetical protein
LRAHGGEWLQVQLLNIQRLSVLHGYTFFHQSGLLTTLSITLHLTIRWIGLLLSLLIN